MTVTNGDILKVVAEFTLESGTIAQNVYYLIADLIADQADLSVVNAIELWIESAYGQLSAQLYNTITQNVCSVNEIGWNAVSEQWEVTRFVGLFTPTIAFSAAVDGLPDQVAALATFTTTRPKTRGRKFMIPFGEASQDSSYLNPAALTAMADYADDILDGIFLGPLNELYSGVPRQAVGEFYEFIMGIVTNVLGTQRRRRPGVGA